MRHKKHRHTLGVKKEHRAALMANLAMALFKEGKIVTTLAKAKALRPFAEKLITLAKKSAKATTPAIKLHYLRQAMARLRNKEALHILFEKRVGEFMNREGGYTRIYKLVPRFSDGADQGMIALIDANDEGYRTRRSSRKGATAATASSAESATPAAESV